MRGCHFRRCVAVWAWLAAPLFPSLAAAQGAPSAPPAQAAQAAKLAAPATPAASPPAPSGATAAPTADQIAKAKTLFDLGAKAYDSEQFPAAIQAFQEAYRLSSRPGPIFSTAQAYRRIYNTDRNPETLRQAVAHYKQYIEKQKTGGRIAEAQQAVRDLEPVLAQLAAAPPGTAPVAVMPVVDAKPKTRLMVSSPTKGASVSLDGGDAAEMPLIQELTPGTHKLRVAADGYLDDEREIIAAEGQVYGLDIPLKERPALLTLRTDAGAQIAIDGRNEGVAPLLRPLELSSGTHIVTITRSGYKGYSIETELRRDEKRAIDVSLERTAQRYGALGVLGAAGAGVLVGGLFTGLAFYEQGVARDIELAKTKGSITEEDRARHEAAARTREDFKMVAYSAFGATGLLAIVGAGMFFFDRPALGVPLKLRDDTKKPEAKRPTKVEASISPWLGPTGAGLSLRASF